MLLFVASLNLSSLVMNFMALKCVIQSFYILPLKGNNVKWAIIVRGFSLHGVPTAGVAGRGVVITWLRRTRHFNKGL